MTYPKNQDMRLKEHVHTLSTEIGERNFQEYPSLLRAAAFIRDQFSEFGYCVSAQDYQVEGELYTNLSIEVPSSNPDSLFIIGAHYDSFLGSPGANDNASAVAVLLELARRLKGTELSSTLQLVAFVNEEPPFFRSAQMGSYVYAKQLADRGEKVQGMICLDTIGFYSEAKSSQKVQFGDMPSVANFVAFVGPAQASTLIERSVSRFRQCVPEFPVLGFTDQTGEASFVNYSDHWPFNSFGWPSFMVTDTGPMRSPHYHTSEDTLEKLDFAKLRQLTDGLEGVLRNPPLSMEPRNI